MLQGIKNKVQLTKEVYQNHQDFLSYDELGFGGPFDISF